LKNTSQEYPKEATLLDGAKMNSLTKTKTNSSLKTFFIITALFTFISCGSQKPMVTDITVKPGYVDNDVYISLTAQLSLGNVTLPIVAIPIFMPKTFEEIGLIQMQTSGAGKNFMQVDINLSAIAHIEAQHGQLPNGGLLPLIGQNKTIVIPVKDKVTVYVSFGDGKAALGVAIPFKTLDGLGKKVGTTSLFPVFNIKNVFGAAGLYTSKTSGKNGFGLFADLTNVLDPVMFFDLGVADQLNLNYSSQVPSYKKEKRINKEMYKLHSRRQRLRIN